MKKKFRLTESELTSLIKKTINKVIKENDYQDYLDTNYSSDGMDDYHHEKELYRKIEKLYDGGKLLYDSGEKKLANKIREKALALAKSTDWSETELPPYGND